MGREADGTAVGQVGEGSGAHRDGHCAPLQAPLLWRPAVRAMVAFPDSREVVAGAAGSLAGSHDPKRDAVGAAGWCEGAPGC
jgi:hypothetical protein